MASFRRADRDRFDRGVAAVTRGTVGATGERGWRLHLRAGVRFHDGSMFDAEDVLATFGRLRDLGEAKAPYGVFLRPVTAVLAPPPLVLELHTATAQPLLPIDLAFIAIIHRAMRGAESEAFDQRSATNGTGPYRLTERPDDRSLLFAAFEDHWRGTPPRREIAFRMIDETGLASITALLAGEVDLIDNVTPDQLVELQARDDVRCGHAGPTGCGICISIRSPSVRRGSPITVESR